MIVYIYEHHYSNVNLSVLLPVNLPFRQYNTAAVTMCAFFLNQKRIIYFKLP